jgi:hypothetical protein
MANWLPLWVYRFLRWLQEYLRPRRYLRRDRFWPPRASQLTKLISTFVSIVRWQVRILVAFYHLLTLSPKYLPIARDECTPRALPKRRTRRLTISSMPSARRENLQTSLQLQSRLLSSLPFEIRQGIFSYVIAGNIIHIARMPLRLCHVTCFEPLNFIGLEPWNRDRSWHECWGMEKHRSTMYYGLHDKNQWNDRDGLLNLLKTCRRIYTETVELLYAGNTFDTNDPVSLCLLSDTTIPHRFSRYGLYKHRGRSV